MDDKVLELISIKVACGRTSLSRTSLYHAVLAKTFPSPIQIGPGRKAFVAKEVDDWIRKRIALRDSETT